MVLARLQLNSAWLLASAESEPEPQQHYVTLMIKINVCVRTEIKHLEWEIQGSLPLESWPRAAGAMS